MINRICLISMPILILSCIEFRISDEEAKEELGESSNILFGDLEVDGRNMHYAFTDNQKAVMAVFIHGSPGSWNAFIEYFKADSLLQEIDILAIDRPGFGNSGYGKAEPSLEKQSYQIKQVLDQFDHESKILIGHSLGGPVIARMAMDYPKLFDGLVLVAPSIDPQLEKKEWYRNAIKTKLGSAMTPEEFEVSNDEIVPLKGELQKMIPLWRNIKIPTIVIQGTADRLVPKENADFAKKMLPDSLVEIKMLKEVNHFIPWSHPHEIIIAIQYLLDGY